MIKIEDPELERLLADASAASGVEPGALLASLLRERVSMANDKENQGSVNPPPHSDSGVNTTRTEFDKCKQKIYEENSLSRSPSPPIPIPIIKNVLTQTQHKHREPGTRNPGKCQVPGTRTRIQR